MFLWSGCSVITGARHLSNWYTACQLIFYYEIPALCAKINYLADYTGIQKVGEHSKLHSKLPSTQNRYTGAFGIQELSSQPFNVTMCDHVCTCITKSLSLLVFRIMCCYVILQSSAVTRSEP